MRGVRGRLPAKWRAANSAAPFRNSFLTPRHNDAMKMRASGGAAPKDCLLGINAPNAKCSTCSVAVQCDVLHCVIFPPLYDNYKSASGRMRKRNRDVETQVQTNNRKFVLYCHSVFDNDVHVNAFPSVRE